MALPRFRVLDSAECSAIDEATRSLLFDTGVAVQSETARAVLADFGAMVDAHSNRVRFPNAVLDDALRSAPKEVFFASRDGKRDIRIPDGRTHVTTDGAGVNVWDLDTGERRPSTAADLADLTRVADALDAVDVQWPMVVAGDVPPERHGLAEIAIALEHTTKNVQHEALSRADAEAMVAIGAAVVGGPEALRRRPILSSVQCPVSPLILEEGSTEAVIVLARAGVPVLPLSMVMMGGSGPVDLAGALLIANAENLASLVVAQAAAPGAPVVWGISSGPVDMRTGSFAAGSPESSLLDVAGVEVARHYGLPCIVGGFACDSDSVGFQAGAEKLATGLTAMLAGPDFMTGIGGLDTDSTMSLEQLVLDADLVEYARRTAEAIRVDADALQLDLVKSLGPGGNYLKQRHTLENFRRMWAPQMLLRDGHVPGQPAERRLRERAKARAAELRKTHRPEPLPEDVRNTIWEIAEGRRV